MLDEYAAAWTSGEVDRILSFLSDDAVYEDPTYQVRAVGREPIRAFVTNVLSRLTDMELVYTRRFATDDFGAAEYRMRSTHRGNLFGMDIAVEGKVSTTIGVSLFEFADGKITRNTDYYDYAANLQSLGVLPEDLSLVVRGPGHWTSEHKVEPA